MSTIGNQYLKSRFARKDFMQEHTGPNTSLDLAAAFGNVSRFNGTFRCFSNFWAEDVIFKGHVFRTNEHAFVAAKASHYPDKLFLKHVSNIQEIFTPGAVKKYGREHIELPDDWPVKRIDVMARLCWRKFSKSPVLRNTLLQTKDAVLIEGNTWWDTDWGMCDTKNGLVGHNHLGRILMFVRKKLRDK